MSKDLCFDEVLVPGPACILQSPMDPTLFNPLWQVLHLRIEGMVRDRAHILLQQPAHKIKARQEKFSVVVSGYIELFINTESGVCDEVRE